MATSTADRPLMAKPDPDLTKKGAIIAHNLIRLGKGKVDVVGVAKLVRESGGAMTSQRLSKLLQAREVRDETVAKIARGLNIPPSELTRPPGDGAKEGRKR
jgi:hypothetical protein